MPVTTIPAGLDPIPPGNELCNLLQNLIPAMIRITVEASRERLGHPFYTPHALFQPWRARAVAVDILFTWALFVLHAYPSQPSHRARAVALNRIYLDLKHSSNLSEQIRRPSPE